MDARFDLGRTSCKMKNKLKNMKKFFDLCFFFFLLCCCDLGLCLCLISIFSFFFFRLCCCNLGLSYQLLGLFSCNLGLSSLFWEEQEEHSYEN